MKASELINIMQKYIADNGDGEVYISLAKEGKYFEYREVEEIVPYLNGVYGIEMGEYPHSNETSYNLHSLEKKINKLRD